MIIVVTDIPDACRIVDQETSEIVAPIGRSHCTLHLSSISVDTSFFMFPIAHPLSNGEIYLCRYQIHQRGISKTHMGRGNLIRMEIMPQL
ncbi:hypothetical protein TNCV_606991 [Trichonephila clavipes]|nr:hypothetical protein TNCV_606991 [Trichonephila clavipes]